MKMKSVSGVTCYVKDLNQTIEFYEALGFDFKKRESDNATAYLNWFWINFVATAEEQKPEFQEEANAEKKGSGIFVNISVEDVDEFYQGVIAKGLTPSSEPKDWPWGSREFVLRDPDGYKLVFFKKK
jgi:catechol 2,3-dioxygenase-like lactoylglutathione lyase family enzyme